MWRRVLCVYFSCVVQEKGFLDEPKNVEIALELTWVVGFSYLLTVGVCIWKCWDYKELIDEAHMLELKLS